jgi:hypothetical protein
MKDVQPLCVIAGLDPAIHRKKKAWMPGIKPA